jgi:hypothetical protein
LLIKFELLSNLSLTYRIDISVIIVANTSLIPLCSCLNLLSCCLFLLVFLLLHSFWGGYPSSYRSPFALSASYYAWRFASKDLCVKEIFVMHFCVKEIFVMHLHCYGCFYYYQQFIVQVIPIFISDWSTKS